MSKRNENRQGYKETKVGWIPKDWKCVRLDSICTVKTGPFGAQLHQSDYVDAGTPIVTVEHLGVRGLAHENLPLVSDNDKQRLSQYILKEGDIVFSRVGSVDRNSLVTSGEDGWLFSGRLLRVRKRHKEIDSRFLSYYFNQTGFKNYMYRIAVGGIMPSLNTSLLSGVSVSLPPLSEQRKIAEILSAWDKAIELVGKKIKAKQRLKKGLMQQLLTGKMRFPGFNDEWKEVALKQLAKLLVSNVDKKSIDDETPVVLCNYMDVYKNEYITSVVDFMSATATKKEIKKFSLKVGDVILTKDSETREDIVSTTVVTEIVNNLVCGYHLAILRPDPKKGNSVFLAKLLSHGRTHHHFVAYANGATRFGLTISAIENAKVRIPSVDEQKRIAQIFLSIDREIEKLDKKINTLRQQKQGLMHKLLTGEVRV